MANGNVNGLGPKTYIMKGLLGGGIDQDALDAVLAGVAYGAASGGKQAELTIAGVGTADGSDFNPGTTTTVFIALQGTEAPEEQTIDSVVLTIEAVFG